MASSTSQKRAESKIPGYNLSNRNAGSTSVPKNKPRLQLNNFFSAQLPEAGRGNIHQGTTVSNSTRVVRQQAIQVGISKKAITTSSVSVPQISKTVQSTGSATNTQQITKQQLTGNHQAPSSQSNIRSAKIIIKSTKSITTVSLAQNDHSSALVRQKPSVLPTISEPVAGPLRREPLTTSTPSAAAVQLSRRQNEGFGLRPPLHRPQSEPVRQSTGKNVLSKPTTTSGLPNNSNQDRQKRPVGRPTTSADRHIRSNSVTGDSRIWSPAVNVSNSEENDVVFVSYTEANRSSGPHRRHRSSSGAILPAEQGSREKTGAAAASSGNNFLSFKTEKLSCPICLDTIKVATSTYCGHIFCKNCIFAALTATKLCPVCKRKQTIEMIHPVYF